MDHEQLYGRILALELLVRGLLTANVIENSSDDTPLKYSADLRVALLDSLRQIRTLPNSSGKRVMDLTAVSLNNMFDHVEERIKAISPH